MAVRPSNRGGLAAAHAIVRNTADAISKGGCGMYSASRMKVVYRPNMDFRLADLMAVGAMIWLALRIVGSVAFIPSEMQVWVVSFTPFVVYTTYRDVIWHYQKTPKPAFWENVVRHWHTTLFCALVLVLGLWANSWVSLLTIGLSALIYNNEELYKQMNEFLTDFVIKKFYVLILLGVLFAFFR